MRLLLLAFQLLSVLPRQLSAVNELRPLPSEVFRDESRNDVLHRGLVVEAIASEFFVEIFGQVQRYFAEAGLHPSECKYVQHGNQC